MYPSHASVLKDTDPEIIEVFENCAFDEVMQYGDWLDYKILTKCLMGTLIARHTPLEYRFMVTCALHVGVPAAEVQETLYHTTPWVGVALMNEFLKLTNEVMTTFKVEKPLPSNMTNTHGTRYSTGLKVQKKLFGNAVEKEYADAPEDEKLFKKVETSFAYGDFYTRSSLDLKTRELLTYSTLLGMGYEEPLKKHIAANIKLGNDRALLLTVLSRTMPYIGFPLTEIALKCIDEVAPA